MAPALPQDRLVRIDKIVDRNRLQHLKKAVRPDPPRYPRGRVTLNDLVEFSEWLKREDYAFAGRGWFERFPDGAAAVGHGAKFETLLAADMSAVGTDLKDIRRERFKPDGFKDRLLPMRNQANDPGRYAPSLELTEE